VQINDIIRITDVQLWATTGQPMLNVYWYQVVAIAEPSTLLESGADIALEFEQTVLVPVRAIQSNSIQHTSLRMTVYGPLEEDYEYLYSPPSTGSAVGEITSTFFTWSFKLNRTFKLTRNGSKRIGGTPDSLSTDARGLNQVGSDFVTDIESALAASLVILGTTGPNMTLQPVIVRQGAAGTGPVNPNPIASATFRGFGTQNSRKQLL
jgi:hypothetical protein